MGTAAAVSSTHHDLPMLGLVKQQNCSRQSDMMSSQHFQYKGYTKGYRTDNNMNERNGKMCVWSCDSFASFWRGVNQMGWVNYSGGKGIPILPWMQKLESNVIHKLMVNLVDG